MVFKIKEKIRKWFRPKVPLVPGEPLIKKEFFDGVGWFAFSTEYYVDHKSLSDFQPPTANISMNNHQITNVPPPFNPTDVANMAYVDSRVIPGGITSVIGFVEGSNPVNNVLTTVRGVTCTLDVIPAENDVSMSGFALKNLKETPDDDYDAVNVLFVWRLLNDEVQLQWS